MIAFSKRRATAVMALSLLALTLTGCVNKPAPLYSWGNYQDQVYQYFKADGSKSTEEQILALQKFEQTSLSTGNRLPPGYHAHLGLLYASAGKEDQAIEELQTEKSLFPESASYMDFLLRKYKK